MPSKLDIVRRQQAALARFTSRALVEANLDSLLLEACIRARGGLGVTHAKLLEYDPRSDSLLLRSGVGWKPGFIGTYRASADFHSAIGYAFNLCEPVPVQDYREQSRFEWPEIMQLHECVSSVNVPLRGETGMFGVLEADHTQPREYSDDDIHFLTGLANTIARSVELHHVLEAKDRALVEKDLLMREMNHRIKNNLTLIAAMLSMQARRHRNDSLQFEFQDAVGRISALAHIHDRLQEHAGNELDAGGYFSDLCPMLYSLLPQHVRLDWRARGTLPGDHIEAMSLLVNEAVTNASKYAFPAGRSGTICVDYESTPRGWTLVISDDGVGLPKDVDPLRSSSFGMTLIRNFAARLGASVTFASEAGTVVKVTSGVSAVRGGS